MGVCRKTQPFKTYLLDFAIRVGENPLLSKIDACTTTQRLIQKLGNTWGATTSVTGLGSTRWTPGISHELGCVGRKRFGCFIRKRRWKMARTEVFSPPGFLTSPQESRGNDFCDFWTQSPH